MSDEPVDNTRAGSGSRLEDVGEPNGASELERSEAESSVVESPVSGGLAESRQGVETASLPEGVAAESTDAESDPHLRRLLVRYHAWTLAAAVLVLLLAFTMRSEGPKEVFLPGMSVAVPELCMSQRMFGLSCPGCGLTRSFITLAHGDFRRSWSFNPAGVLVFVFVVGQIPWRIVQVKRLRQGESELSPKVFTVPLLMMGGALVFQWLYRLLS